MVVMRHLNVSGIRSAVTLVAAIAGVRQYVQFLQEGAVAVRAVDGQYLWRGKFDMPDLCSLEELSYRANLISCRGVHVNPIQHPA